MLIIVFDIHAIQVLLKVVNISSSTILQLFILFYVLTWLKYKKIKLLQVQTLCHIISFQIALPFPSNYIPIASDPILMAYNQGTNTNIINNIPSLFDDSDNNLSNGPFFSL